MAVDGSLIFNTKVDISNFNKAINTINKSVSDISDKINSKLTQVENAVKSETDFVTNEVKKQSQEQAAATQNAVSKVEESTKSAVDNIQSSADKSVENVSNVSKAVSGSVQKSTSNVVNNFEKSTTGASSKVIDLQNKISKTEREISKVIQELNKMENTPFKSDAAAKLEKDVAKAKESLNALYAEADKIGDSVKQNLEETGFTLEHLDDMLASNKGWQKVQSQIDVAEQKLEKYERELRQVKAVDSQVDIKETAAYTKKSQKLEELSGNLDYYKAKLQETSAEEQNTTAEITESSDELTSSIMSSSDLITMAIKAVTAAYETFKKVVVTTAKIIANASITIANGIGYMTEQAAKFTLKQFIGDWEKQGSGLSKLFLAAASYFSIYKLFDLGKEGVELGSNLAKVQDVVDVTFSSMSDKVENFAKSAEKTYGLSETMAKKYVGLYGSMAEAFGFTEEKAYDMSTTLTGLAGDVASFYNIEQDLAYTKLKSVFSGETETLKDLGIVMTQTALDNYALANGYKKTISEMSEAEKVTLRYNFVLDQLSNATGDFARTQNSWANQVRILQLRWQSLLATMGKGLINVFTPLLQVLNAVLNKLQSIAEWFENIVTAVFGDSSDSSGAVIDIGTDNDALSDLTDNANAAADAINDVSDAASDLKDNIASFDELNIMDGTQENSASDTVTDLVADVVNATGVIDSALNDAVDSAVKKAEKTVKQSNLDKALVYAVKHGQWKQVGYLVAEKISNALDKIQWGDIQNQAVEIATNIGDFINGALNNKELWRNVGKTIAKGLNTAILFVGTLLSSIDFYLLGDDIATVLNTFMDNFKAEEYGVMVAEWINAIFATIGGFAFNFNWGELGNEIGETLASYFQTLNLTENKDGKPTPTIAESIAQMINGLVQSGIELFTYEFEDEEGNIHNLWEYIGAELGKGLNQFLETFSIHDAITLIKSGVSAFVKVIYNAFKELAGEDGKGFLRLGAKLAKGLNEWFEDESWWSEMGEMFDEIANDILDFLISFLVNLDTGKIDKALDSLFSNIDFDSIFGKLALVASLALNKALALFLKRIPWIGDTLSKNHEYFLTFIHGKEYADMIYGSLDLHESSKYGTGGRSIGEEIGDTIGQDVTSAYGKAVENGESDMSEKTVSAVQGSIGQATDFVENDTSLPLAFKTQGINSQNALTGNFKTGQVKSHFKGVWSGIQGVFAGVSGWFEDTFGTAWDKVKGIFSDKDGIANIKKSVEEAFKNTLNDFIDGINDIIANPFDTLNSAFNSIRNVEFFGAKVFEWLPVITTPQIPKLATGTVVPANYGEFLAVLGDNKREAEVVSPISAMKQAMSEVLAEFGGAGNGDITLTVNLDGREIYRSVVDYNERQRKRTGKSGLV